MTGTDLCVNKPHKSRSYLNHLVYTYIYIYYLIEQHSKFLLHALQVLYMCTLCGSTNINTIIEFIPNYKSYCSTVHFCRITSIYQPTNAHIISHKTILKHFKTLRHVSILPDHHQGAVF